jgi:anaerobic dimethyl sulfoxide reductase subunit C (anchor subunit)
MYSADWPLVVFTLLVQMSVGLLIVSELAALAAGPAGRRLFAWRECFAFGIGVVGLAFSFGHLGTPFNSPFAILNVGSSWLSREILCTGFFLGCTFVLAVARHWPGFERFAAPLAVLACLLGLASIYAMSRVYAIVTVPAWNSPATGLGFAGSAFLLGALAVGVLGWVRAAGINISEVRAVMGRVTTVVLLFAALGLVLKFAEIPLSLIGGMGVNARGVSGVSALLAAGAELYVLRLVLLVLGAVVFVYAAIGALADRGAALPAMAGCCGFAIVLAGEVIGRLGFFDMHVLMGL